MAARAGGDRHLVTRVLLRVVRQVAPDNDRNLPLPQLHLGDPERVGLPPNLDHHWRVHAARPAVGEGVRGGSKQRGGVSIQCISLMAGWGGRKSAVNSKWSDGWWARPVTSIWECSGGWTSGLTAAVHVRARVVVVVEEEKDEDQDQDQEEEVAVEVCGDGGDAGLVNGEW